MLAFTVVTRPNTSSKLVTLSHRNTLVIPERPHSWETVHPDMGPNEYNLITDPPPTGSQYLVGLKLIQSCKDSVTKNGQWTDYGASFMLRKRMKDRSNKLLTTCVAKGRAKTKNILRPYLPHNQQ